MAPTIDARNFFDQHEIADTIIKCGTREFKCHRFVLFTASDYFKKLLSPTGRFKEAREGVVVLKGHGPQAVEAVLRYIYSFEYEDIIGKDKIKSTPEYHLSVYAAAHEYQMEKLTAKAFAAMENALSKVQTGIPITNGGYGPNDVFELVKLLAAHKDYHAAFTEKSHELVRKHLAALMTLKTFRAWLEQDNNPALKFVLAAVANPSTVELQICHTCLKVAVDDPALDHQCSYGLAGNYACGRLTIHCGKQMKFTKILVWAMLLRG
ncbi:uncharacterized protein LTR77_000049 [Saxophila tyrrhenica]|uniref:BTB domain-containing protein n=1 Tax=Saxophila tyrrhenica TaxID=1690608 RepID=A0AAV9PRC1_9PEZI|nr:hypothetical protein LTR77_000049 [Saxophila tyrrhenica]